MIGTSRTTISSWRGRGNIPYAVCADVAQTRDVYMDWLLFGTAPTHVAEDAGVYDAGAERCDAALLARSIALVKVGMVDRDQGMVADREAELVMAVYALLQGGADEGSVLRIVRSAA